MMEFGQPTSPNYQTRNILAIAKDLRVPPASFNHITDTKSLGHLEHAANATYGAECDANLDVDQWP